MNKQEAAMDKYIKEKHTQEECIGFIDGFNVANSLSLTEIEGLKKEIAELKNPIAVPLLVKSGEEKPVEDWCKPVDGIINVPDWLDPLINKVGFHVRVHTISKRTTEAEMVCRIVKSAQDFFAATPTKSDEVERLKGIINDLLETGYSGLQEHEKKEFIDKFKTENNL